MAEKMPQTFENHTRFVPLYHFVAGPIFLINLLWAVYRLIAAFSLESVIGTAIALALVFLFFFVRVFALGAQDRVIRLEERLRMQGVLADDLKPRINEFTIDQICALRFAADDEFSDLAVGRRACLKNTTPDLGPLHAGIDTG